jgi:hypothetical protein
VARDDWRIRIHFDQPDEARGLLERLGLALGGEAAELARELEERRLAVSFDEDDVFVYASSRQEAERANAVVDAVLREQGAAARASGIEHWLADEERWDGEPAEETWEDEELEHGHAPWEVRVEAESHAAARELAERLEAEGLPVVRRWKYVVVGAATEAEARELARRLHGEVEAGGEVVWESVPGNPFAVFGGMGSAGTPL